MRLITSVMTYLFPCESWKPQPQRKQEPEIKYSSWQTLNGRQYSKCFSCAMQRDRQQTSHRF